MSAFLAIVFFGVGRDVVVIDGTAADWSRLSAGDHMIAPVFVGRHLLPAGRRFSVPVAGPAPRPSVWVAWVSSCRVEQRLIRATAVLYTLAATVAFIVPTPLGANLNRFGMYAAGPALLAVRPDAPACWCSSSRGCCAGSGRRPSTPSCGPGGIRRRGGVLPAARRLPGVGGRGDRPGWRSCRPAALGGRVRGLALSRSPEGGSGSSTSGSTRCSTRTGSPRRSTTSGCWSRGSTGWRCPMPVDDSGVEEAALIRGGLEYLRPVWSDRHWDVYEVIEAGSPRRCRRGRRRWTSTASPWRSSSAATWCCGCTSRRSG